VATEWQNLPDLKKAAEQAQPVQQPAGEGRPELAAEGAVELGGALSEVRKMLENNAESFGESRLPAGNKTMAEAMRKLGDLEGDERFGGRRQRRRWRRDGREAGPGDGGGDGQVRAETREKLETPAQPSGHAHPERAGGDGT
jgi:hypothetical protein